MRERGRRRAEKERLVRAHRSRTCARQASLARSLDACRSILTAFDGLGKASDPLENESEIEFCRERGLPAAGELPLALVADDDDESDSIEPTLPYR